MRQALASSLPLVAFLATAPAAADRLPQCRVRVVKSAKADAVALHRFILEEPWPTPAGPREVARRLGVVLSDVCLGLNPAPPSGTSDRR